MSKEDNVNEEERHEYPMADIQAVRASLIDQWIKRVCRSDFEMNLKRKCGIHTDEVVAYFESEKRVVPERFDAEYVAYTCEKEPEGKLIEIDEPLPPIDEQKKPENAQEAENVSDIEENQEESELQERSIQTELDLIESHFERVSLRVDKKRHACFNNDYTHVCAFSLSTEKRQVDKSSTASTVYICNFCRQCYPNENRMKQHLEDRRHFSAGEYEASRTNRPVMNYCKCEIGSYVREVLSAKRRVAIRLDEPREEKSAKGVFCPKCDMFFSVDVLACSVHYRFMHGGSVGNDHGYMYSVSDLLEVRDITLTVEHRCLDCDVKFTRLKDLSAHLEQSRHAPCPPKEQIYVFKCGQCAHRTTHFHHFKTHLMEHQRAHDELYGEVYAYARPLEYYHMSESRTSLEYKEEMQCIERLVAEGSKKLTASVNDVVLKPLLDRKSQLASLL